MGSLTAKNVPDALYEMLWYMKTHAVEEDSRNGPVKTYQHPFTLTIRNPIQRVLTSSARNANPFFHALEFVWMMAGRNDAEFVGKLVKRMWDYAEDDGKFHAAYGHRWRRYFGNDQVKKIIDLIKDDPTTRRAVLAMWDAPNDLLSRQYRDHPCNTHAYFRVRDDYLDMTVCNRSNDVIWGMLGANSVHMTMLHETVARFTGFEQGYYHVMTNNAHIYEQFWGLMDEPLKASENVYVENEVSHIALQMLGDTYEEFVTGCAAFCEDPTKETGLVWLDEVAAPLYQAYMEENPTKALEKTQHILAKDWRIAAVEWLERNRCSS